MQDAKKTCFEARGEIEAAMFLLIQKARRQYGVSILDLESIFWECLDVIRAREREAIAREWDQPDLRVIRE